MELELALLCSELGPGPSLCFDPGPRPGTLASFIPCSTARPESSRRPTPEATPPASERSGPGSRVQTREGATQQAGLEACLYTRTDEELVTLITKLGIQLDEQAIV